MDRIRLLHNPLRAYAWGSHTFLAELRGAATPSEGPEAELWMGAHPQAPSEVEEGPGRVALDEWIARDPERALGSVCRERFGDALPFLLKIIAPECALSLQTHPDAERARRGFERENLAGIPASAPTRNYRDPNPKPELVCALTPFRALCGFRPRAQAAAWLEELAGPAIAAWTQPLHGNADEAYPHFLGALLRAEEAERTAIVSGTLAAARSALEEVGQRDAQRGERERACALVVELAEQFPDDVGVLAPLFMNFVELAPGEALFLEAGTLHAYLGGGAAVELMANSDNVLRCGLTPKHVDIPELLAALAPDEGGSATLRPRATRPAPAGEAEPAQSSLSEYAADTPWFGLARLELERSGSCAFAASHGPEIWLCSAGRARILGAQGERVTLRPGDAAWIPAAAGGYRIEADDSQEDAAGRGGAARPRLFRAGIRL